MIHVYTGAGKGKTTAALGLALRALGWGKKVCLVQFLKRGARYGELRSLKRFPGCRLIRCGRGVLLTRTEIREVDRSEAERGLARARKVLKERTADVLILDEINVALHFKLIPLAGAKDLIRRCPPEIELVLTGRRCPRALMKLADYVSEIKEIRHPFRIGIKGRKGIEY